MLAEIIGGLSQCSPEYQACMGEHPPPYPHTHTHTHTHLPHRCESPSPVGAASAGLLTPRRLSRSECSPPGLEHTSLPRHTPLHGRVANTGGPARLPASDEPSPVLEGGKARAWEGFGPSSSTISAGSTSAAAVTADGTGTLGQTVSLLDHSPFSAREAVLAATDTTPGDAYHGVLGTLSHTPPGLGDVESPLNFSLGGCSAPPSARRASPFITPVSSLRHRHRRRRRQIGYDGGQAGPSVPGVYALPAAWSAMPTGAAGGRVPMMQPVRPMHAWYSPMLGTRTNPDGNPDGTPDGNAPL